MTPPTCQRCGYEADRLNTDCELKMVCDICFYSVCPSDCDNYDSGTCPRCYVTTGNGCDHGPLCYDCRLEVEEQVAEAPCEICLKPMDMKDVMAFVHEGASWTSPVPCCHGDCVERDERGSSSPLDSDYDF